MAALGRALGSQGSKPQPLGAHSEGHTTPVSPERLAALTCAGNARQAGIPPASSTSTRLCQPQTPLRAEACDQNLPTPPMARVGSVSGAQLARPALPRSTAAPLTPSPRSAPSLPWAELCERQTPGLCFTGHTTACCSPAFPGILDSTEVERINQTVLWLREPPPGLREGLNQATGTLCVSSSS